MSDLSDKVSKKAHIDVRCNEETLKKWKDLFYEKKRKGWDAERLLLALMDAYARAPEGRYF